MLSVFACVIAAVFASHASGPESVLSMAPLLSFLTCCCGFSWYIAATGGYVDVRLVVIGSDQLRLVGVQGKRDVAIEWGNPRLRLLLYDMRGLTQGHRDGAPRRQFVLSPRYRMYIPIPEGAYEAIMRVVEAHGLTVAKMRMAGNPMRGSAGTYEQIRVSARRG